MSKAQEWWQRMVDESGLCNWIDGAVVWYVLTHLYGHPNRHYHNWAHIDEMFERAETWNHLITDPIPFRLAILFHDAYYIPGDDLSVLRSAALFEHLGSCFEIGRARIWRTSDMIKATDHPVLAQTDQGKLLADLDLLGLSNTWDQFLSVGTKVWEECQESGIQRSDYVKGAIKFWRALLERQNGIYQRPEIFQRHEKAARENVTRYVELLKSE